MLSCVSGFGFYWRKACIVACSWLGNNLDIGEAIEKQDILEKIGGVHVRALAGFSTS